MPHFRSLTPLDMLIWICVYLRLFGISEKKTKKKTRTESFGMTFSRKLNLTYFLINPVPVSHTARVISRYLPNPDNSRYSLKSK